MIDYPNVEPDGSMNITKRQVDFIRHFVEQYQKNIAVGLIKDANHDATAITLFFKASLGLDLGCDNDR